MNITIHALIARPLSGDLTIEGLSQLVHNVLQKGEPIQEFWPNEMGTDGWNVRKYANNECTDIPANIRVQGSIDHPVIAGTALSGMYEFTMYIGAKGEVFLLWWAENLDDEMRVAAHRLRNHSYLFLQKE